MPFPDFIGIGMERAGSSWIFYMLASHPDVWVPPIKEIHYFDSLSLKPEETWRYKKHLKIRIKGKLAPLLKIPEDRPQLFKNTYLEYLSWDLNYFTGSYNNSWYKSLFSEKYTKNRICGEVTPAYSTISEEIIKNICTNFSDTKLIISVRDPVERTKSALFHFFRGVKKRQIEKVPQEELLEWLDQPTVKERSYCSQILDKWEKNSNENQIILIDFNDISRHPEIIIESLYDSFNLDKSFRPAKRLINEKIFSFKEERYALPNQVIDKIFDLYRDERNYMAKRYPSLVKYWDNI
jgi:hypothetical protein